MAETIALHGWWRTS
ncbi:trp operon leader peptide [Salmonella enterica]|nr:trp operon leader peptide [Salmonella enterica]